MRNPVVGHDNEFTPLCNKTFHLTTHEMHVAFLKFTNYQAMMLYKNDTLGDLIKKSMNDPTYAKTFLSKQNAKEQEPYPQVMSEHNMMDNGSWERILTNEEEKEFGYSEPMSLT